MTMTASGIPLNNNNSIILQSRDTLQSTNTIEKTKSPS